MQHLCDSGPESITSATHGRKLCRRIVRHRLGCDATNPLLSDGDGRVDSVLASGLQPPPASLHTRVIQKSPPHGGLFSESWPKVCLIAWEPVTAIRLGMKASEAAAMLGRIGGKSTSPAKQAASRANGKLGGRKKSANRTEPDSNHRPVPGAPLLFISKEAQCHAPEKV